MTRQQPLPPSTSPPCRAHANLICCCTCHPLPPLLCRAEATLEAILSEHRTNPLDLLLHVGDLSYGDGRFKCWGAFMEMIEPLAAEVPYMVR